MSNSVDQRIVEMQFDNASFEKNASTTLGTLKKLESSIDFKGGVESLKSIDAAISKADFSSMANGIETVSERFSAMGVIGATVINRLTNMAMDMGGNLVKAVTVQPLMDGLDEYKLKMDSIKTIQANTGLYDDAGLARINSVLGELNAYADQTIYNFAEMTKNIGTFTAAGVGLEESATAIKGIANLAAASGSSSQQAAVAMYQLSQALAAGSVKLQDWNSVVNAGMGGRMFQNALIDTSRALGTGADEYIEAEGSFRESLKNGWVTQEVLTKTLRNFTLEANEANREMLRGEGYTEEQINKIFELSQAATDAATKVKTFQQLVDTTKEALGSGWAQTWEYIIGDIMQAEKLWTWVSEGLNSIINGFSDARNQFFKEWNEGDASQGVASGWMSMFYTLQELAGIVGDLVQPIVDAFHAVFEPLSGIEAAKATNNLLIFVQNLRRSLNESVTGQAILKGIGLAFTVLFTIIKMGATIVKTAIGIIVHVIGAGLTLVADVIEFLATGIKALFDFLAGIDITGVFAPIADFLTNVLHADAVVSFFKSVGDSVATFVNAVASGMNPIEALQNFFDSVGQTSSGAFSSIASGLSGIGDAVGRIKAAAAPVVMNGLSKAFETLGKIWTKVEPIFMSLKDKLVDVWNSIVTAFQNSGFSFEPFLNLFGSIGEAFSEFIESIASGEGINIESLAKFFGSLKDALMEFLKGAAEPMMAFFGELGGRIAEALGGPFKSLYDWVTSIESPIEAITSAFQKLIDSIVNLPSDIKLPWGGDDAAEGAMSLEDAVNTGYTAVNKLDKLTSFIANPIQTVSKFVSNSLKGIGQAVRDFISGLEAEGMGEVLEKLGQLAALGGIAVVLNETSKFLHSAENFMDGIAAFSKSLSAIGNNLASTVNALNSNLKVAVITQLAVSVGILAASLYAISRIQPERLLPSMEALLVLIGVVTAIMIAVGKLKLDEVAIAAFANSMRMLAVSFGILTVVVAVLGSLREDQLSQGMHAIETLAAVIGVLAVLASKAQGLSAAGTALLEMAVAMAILVGVAWLIGAVGWETLIPGAIAIGVMLLALIAVSFALTRIGKDGGKMVAGTSALVIMAAAIAVLVVCIGALSLIMGMNPEAAMNACQYIMWILAELAIVAILMDLLCKNEASFVAAAASLVVMASALLIIVAAVAALAFVSTIVDVVPAMIMIAVMLIAMAGAIVVLGAVGDKAALGAAALVTVAIALGLLMAVVVVMGTVPIDQLVQGMVALAVGLLVFVGVTIVFSAAATYFAVGMALIIGFILAIGITALMFASALNTIVNAMTNMANITPGAVDAFIQGLSQLGQGLWNIRGDIAMGIAGIGSGIIQGLVMIIPAAVSAIIQLIISMAQAFIAALPTLVQTALIGIVMLIASISDGLQAYGPALGQALMQLGMTILQGIVTMITEALAAVLGAIDGIVETVTGSSPNFAQAARDLGQAAVDGLGETMEGMDHEALDEVKSAAQAITDGGNEAKGNAQKAGADIKQGFSDGTEGTAEAVKGNLSGIPDVTSLAGSEALSQLQGSMDGSVDLSAVTSSFSEMGTEIPNIGTEAGTGFGENLKESVAAIDISDAVEQDIDSGAITEKMAQAGVDAATGFNDGFHNTLQIDGSQVDTSGLADSGGFSDAASQCANAYTQSLSSGLGQVASIAQNAGQSAVNGLRSGGAGGYSAGWSVGHQLSAGVAAGMWAGYGSIASAANSIIDMIDRVLRKKSEIRSPSKMTARIGRYLSEGLAVGMLDRERYVTSTAENVMTSVLRTMSSGYVDALMGDVDDNPTIRPVLDLDEYVAGIDAMNAMMPTDQYLMAGRIMGYGNVASPFSSSTTNSALYEINLNYTKDADANQMVEDLTRELHYKNMMEAR